MRSNGIAPDHTLDADARLTAIGLLLAAALFLAAAFGVSSPLASIAVDQQVEPVADLDP